MNVFDIDRSLPLGTVILGDARIIKLYRWRLLRLLRGGSMLLIVCNLRVVHVLLHVRFHRQINNKYNGYAE